MKISTPNLKVVLSSARKEDFPSLINLHMHSTFSDGALTPEQIQSQVQKKGIKMFALTDHNEVAGAKKLSLGGDIVDVSGPEIDAWHKNVRVHLLGLNVDLDNPHLAEFNRRSKAFLEKTKNAVVITREQAKEAPTTKQAIDAIKKADGLAVLAHPGVVHVVRLKKFVKTLQKQGLDAVETEYPYPQLKNIFKYKRTRRWLVDFANLRTKNLRKFAKKRGLLCTGGTDCHAVDIERTFDKKV